MLDAACADRTAKTKLQITDKPSVDGCNTLQYLYHSLDYRSIQSIQSFTSCWEYLILNENLKRMVQPDACVSLSAVSGLKNDRHKTIPAQDKRQKWKKNYMAVSMPCQNYHNKCLKVIRQTDNQAYMQSQSLHSQTSVYKQDRYQRRLLKILQKCAESIEELSSQSYVESMRSCSSLAGLSDYQNEDLIDLSDNPVVLDVNHSTDRPKTYPDNKHYSEIVLRNGVKLGGFYHLDRGDEFYSSFNNDKPLAFVTPKLKIGDSFSSSYIEDSDVSYTDAQSYGEVDIQSLKDNTVSASRTNTCQRTRYEDYSDLMSKGKSTAFLSEDENQQSFYYDDEFDTDNSLVGRIHDSDLEAAICNEYASLLDNAAGQLLPNSVAEDYQSNFSSDFDNIFPASLSLREDASVDEGCSFNEEESRPLDESVPSYSNIPCTATDYQITFTQAGSLYSDARSGCFSDSDSENDDKFKTPLAKVRSSPKSNQVPKPPRAPKSTVHLSTKKVSFSDELATITQDCQSNEEKMNQIGNSTTWQEMKQNYTTWGQVKIVKDDPKKSKSTPDMRQANNEVQLRQKPRNEANKNNRHEERKRYSLTLWEQYKRTHSMSLSASLSELTTPEVFNEPARFTAKDTRQTEDLRKSINNLIDDAIGKKKNKDIVCENKIRESLKLPDVSFLRTNKTSLSDYKWWTEIFDQPSFCAGGTCIKSCSQCERKHSADHQIILFQGSQAKQHKICQLSMLEQLLSAGSNCQCIRDKLCDLSSGIATGSSGATPREPNSWQHIADFLKRRQKTTDGNSRGSLNTTLSDQQLLDVAACIEAADLLAKHYTQSANDSTNELLVKVWKLVSALECMLSLGLKSHKLVTVAMGKIRARVNIWDVVEETVDCAESLTNTFSQVMTQISLLSVEESSLRLCLFVVGLLNSQCLDFWLQILIHNKQLMDKYYEDDSFLRSSFVGDKKLVTEVIQSLQPLSLFQWDIDLNNMLKACTRSDTEGTKSRSSISAKPSSPNKTSADANQRISPVTLNSYKPTALLQNKGVVNTKTPYTVRHTTKQFV